MIRSIFEAITEIDWREYLAHLVEFACIAVIIATVALICVGLMPQ